MSEQQGGNGKEQQAEGARNYTAEPLEEGMKKSHNSVCTFLMVIVSSHIGDTFLREER